MSRDARNHLTRTIRLRLGKTAKCINSTAKESNKKIAPKSDFFMYDVSIGLVNLSALHSVLVVLLINEYILLIRVDMTFLCLIHDITKGYYIGD